ncbi:Type II secretion system protein E [bacterium HR15]|uniref:Type IV pilus assembly protein PilB n=1 Tax=uncultured prokaryote TaxID=198431 RepID=H5SN73_9ZZZZ|nr:type IV pilus assembly protein PilB [uncultured prokaryote]GBC91656.1 Type II secretion system protein E [bacterium HR15]
MAMTRKSLGEYLIEKGLITHEQLEDAMRVQQATGKDLAQILVDQAVVSERDAYEAKAYELGMPFVDLDRTTPDPSAVNVVKEHIAKRYNVMPVKKEGNILYLAMADPNNVMAIDDVRVNSRCVVRPVLAAPGAIEDAIRRAYGGSAIAGDGSATAAGEGGGTPARPADLKASVMSEVAAYSARGDLEEDEKAVLREAEEGPIVRAANIIIQRAIDERASDIHVEPQIRNVRIRYRIDGVLHEVLTLPKYIQAPLISRYKIMAEMNIAEKRLPQDGRIPIRYQNKDYDLRVSSIPTPLGEKIVMRILDKTSVLIGLNKLGFTPETQARLEELVIQPQGMVLSTGPTGSGKTTTQYSILHKLNSVEKNILTIEDPIEYQLPGISQVQVNRKAGLTFANALRAFLRQDPDIIMVGEMRDLETAEIAIEAALTGHLVLSTLHTNDAPSAVIRMIDMGVEPYLISATVTGVLAQRLARRVCQKCKQPREIRAADLRAFGFQVEDPDQVVTIWEGTGCEECRYRGYKGRIGIFELMVVNAEIAELIVRRAPLADIKEAAKANGMKELREDGLIKVLEGVTTPDEVRRVVFTAGYY